MTRRWMRASLVVMAVLACLFVYDWQTEDAARPPEATPPVEAPARPVVRPEVVPVAVSPVEYRESMERGIDMLLAEAGTPRGDAVKQVEALLREFRLELKDHLLHDLLPALREMQAEYDRKAKALPPSHPELQALARRIAEAQSSIIGVISRVMPVLTEDDLAVLGLPRDLVLDLGGGVVMELALIPAGTFTMGSPETEANRNNDEGPQRAVTLSKPFYLGIHEVTQAQYQAVMGRNPSQFKGENLPVENVSWNDAVAFCKKLSEKTGRTVRLPTEAEWEYACRAGTTTPFHTGNTISTDQANYNGNGIYGDGRKGVYREKTVPVGSFRPNAWGFYDMHGNMWEWCSDWVGPYGKAAETDPTGTATGDQRVLRGGSWYISPQLCRSADRAWNSPDFRGNYNGFRVVVEAGVD